MPTLLLTGFEPFAGHPENPTAHLCHELDGLRLGNWQVKAQLLPVEPHQAGEQVVGLLRDLHPDAVLLTGLAAGRPQVTLERVAVNVMDFRIPDNAGQTYQDAPIVATGPDAYLSTLPLRGLLGAWAAAGVPGRISNTAGLYVCNCVMYRALHELAQSGRGAVPCGFLHVPANAAVALAQPAREAPMPYLPQQEVTRAVQVALEVLAGVSRESL